MTTPPQRLEAVLSKFYADHGFTGPDVNETTIRVFSVDDPPVTNLTELMRRIADEFGEDARTGRKY